MSQIAQAIRQSMEPALYLPAELFEPAAGTSFGAAGFRLKEAIPQSCISATEYILDRLAGSTRPFDYQREVDEGEVRDIHMQAQFRQANGGVHQFNASDDLFAEHAPALPLANSVRDITQLPLPDIGQGLMLAETRRNQDYPGAYPFHFMAVVGAVVSGDARVKAAIISDVSEPQRRRGERLPEVWDLSLRLIHHTHQVRDASYTRQRYRLGRVLAQPSTQ
ncbi:hypothetical protein [Serratia marcescens]|uniref:hypothetical protein n=1 Tax=Serratia marcescens TaxID=615 RepID=UPI003FA70E6D